MRSVITTARTIDEAIAKALAELDLPLESVSVEVLRKGNRSDHILPDDRNQVRVTEKMPPDTLEKARLYAEQLLHKMGINCNVTAKAHGKGMLLEIWNAPDGAVLIGYRGSTLNAIQYLVSQYMNKTLVPGVERTEIEVDTQDYRERRRRMLTKIIKEAMFKLESTGKEVELESMSDVDRKFVHLLIKENYPDLTTTSIGEGESRHIVLGKYKLEY